MFKIGTIVSYRGRLHVVIGVTPMSATPQLVELEDRESGRFAASHTVIFNSSRNPTRAFEITNARATSKHTALMSPFGSSATSRGRLPASRALQSW